MKKSKPETNAKLLHLKSNTKASSAANVSEVTRLLFSETWKNYLDDVTMVSMKVTEKSIKEVKKGIDFGKPKKHGKLFLVK